ncbi:hypothetical protein DLJ53_20135 [Acuticoccus sediminis]|uniref:Glycosyltransferase 61 catalytic domain-containing protein n=1 Tax=Acuticoccus sediminis TaxID=2184697 RepID=A0A8B2NPW6_9HYPH|nr:glycosyltransferase family 61 protein [Acuticoccus sediminis]RAI00038.1 hypothetical protein DLJ53_20135 [Acuticoccus sediminis]
MRDPAKPSTAPAFWRRVMRLGRPSYPRDKAFGDLVYRSREQLLAAHGLPPEDRTLLAEALAANEASGAVPAIRGIRVAPLAVSETTVLPERPNPLESTLPWALFRGTKLNRGGLRMPMQKALTVLEYRDVCLATTGNRFTIFRGDTVDPASSAVLERQERLAANAEPLAFAAFCDDFFPGAANPAHFVGDRLTRAYVFTQRLGVAPEGCLFGGATALYPAYALDRVCPGANVARSDRVYRVARLLVLSSTAEMGGHPFYYLDPEAMDFILTRLLADLPAAGERSRAGRRLYLARTDAGARVLLNERPLIEALGREGFEAVEMGALAPAEQLALARDAEVVVAPHGAALTNLVAARPGTCVVELFNPNRGTTVYMAIAHALGLGYTPHFGTPVAGDRRRDAWTVDIDGVLGAVRSAADRIGA